MLADALLDDVDQPRLADARLAHQEDRLADPLAGLLPAILEQAHLEVAADQGSQAGGARDVDPGPCRALRSTRKSSSGRGSPLIGCAQALAHGVSLDQVMHRLGDDQGPGLGHRLQAGRHAPGLAQDAHRLASRAGGGVADDGRAGVDGDPGRQVHPLEPGGLRREPGRALEDPQAGLDGPVGRVLEGQGVAEADHQPGARRAQDRPLVAVHLLLAELRPPAQQQVPVPGLEDLEELDRLAEVVIAVEDRDLAAFGLPGGGA